MAHIHSVYDTDPHFVIDPITRAIINQSTTKTQLMQYDHNSERFTFEIPRLVDGHDMQLCDKIEIHYIDVDAATKQFNADVYPVDDMQLSPESDDVVIFSWLISGNATQYAGTLNFIIRFFCHTRTTIDYAWGTDIFKGIPVGGSYSNGEMVVAKYTYTDVLEAWKEEVLGSAGGGGNKLKYQHKLTVRFAGDWNRNFGGTITFGANESTPIINTDEFYAYVDSINNNAISYDDFYLYHPSANNDDAFISYSKIDKIQFNEDNRSAVVYYFETAGGTLKSLEFDASWIDGEANDIVTEV